MRHHNLSTAKGMNYFGKQGLELLSSYGGPKTGTPEIGRVDLTTLVQMCHASKIWLSRLTGGSQKRDLE